MSIERLPMWRVTCDGCGTDDGSEYWAWAEESQAREVWEEADGLVLPDGRAFCDTCALPPEYCRFGYRDEFQHVPDDDDASTCAECEQPIPASEKVPA